MTHKCHPFPLALNIRCIAGQTERPDGQMDIIYATGAFASTPCWTLNLGRNIVFANKIQVQKDSCCRARLLIERKTNSNCWKQLCFVPSLIPHRLKPCQQKFKSPSKFHRDQSTSPQTEVGQWNVCGSSLHGVESCSLWLSPWAWQERCEEGEGQT